MSPRRAEQPPDPPRPIVGECVRCRLPIYEDDPHETIPDWPWEGKGLYHSTCAWRVQAIYWEEQLNYTVGRLRTLGFKCVVTLNRPHS